LGDRDDAGLLLPLVDEPEPRATPASKTASAQNWLPSARIRQPSDSNRPVRTAAASACWGNSLAWSSEA
jgi:hypothetical protein